MTPRIPYATEVVGEKRQGSSRPSQQDYNDGPSYDESTFNPDDEIPF